MSARPARPSASRDPLVWCWAIAAAFLLLALHRLTIPSKPFFDEIHYLPATRALLALDKPLNREHPLVAKELMAVFFATFGDNPFGWRIGSALAGALTLFAAMRALWWASLSRVATILFGMLLASNFTLFVTARIAMLDPYLLAFTLAALWAFARAWRDPAAARRNLALCGVLLGLAIGCKWTAAPIAVVPGLALAAARLAARRRGDEGPMPDVSLAEAFMLIGVLPILVYFATFMPYGFFAQERVAPWQLPAFQKHMLDLQESVVKPHPYQSRWWQWLLDLRPMWYLYERADDAQRGVLFVGNPLTMWAGLPALVASAWWGWRERDGAMLAVTALFAAGFLPWVIAPKPVQFYYHYLLPGIFLLGALGLVLARWWNARRRWPALAIAAGSVALFAWFYPILSAARLPGKDSFLAYAWLPSWR